MSDAYAAALAEHIKDSATTWVRHLEEVPGGEASVKWQTDGTVVIEDVAYEKHGPYRVTVIVEPAETWREVTWYDVAQLPDQARPVVRLGGVEAIVLSAVAQRWHVDPRSPERYPSPLEHDVVRVKLQMPGQEPKSYDMPPSGTVEMMTEAMGPAVANIVNAFPTTKEKGPR